MRARSGAAVPGEGVGRLYVCVCVCACVCVCVCVCASVSACVCAVKDATILTVRWPSLIFALSRCKYGLGASTSRMSRRLWRSWSMVIHPRATSEMAETTADKQYATHTCRAAGRTVETHSGISARRNGTVGR